ncbi:MAG: hypothetical protein ACRC4M_05760 [Mycoplasma sp.]
MKINKKYKKSLIGGASLVGLTGLIISGFCMNAVVPKTNLVNKTQRNNLGDSGDFFEKQNVKGRQDFINKADFTNLNDTSNFLKNDIGIETTKNLTSDNFIGINKIADGNDTKLSNVELNKNFDVKFNRDVNQEIEAKYKNKLFSNQSFNDKIDVEKSFFNTDKMLNYLFLLKMKEKNNITTKNQTKYNTTKELKNDILTNPFNVKNDKFFLNFVDRKEQQEWYGNFYHNKHSGLVNVGNEQTPKYELSKSLLEYNDFFSIIGNLINVDKSTHTDKIEDNPSGIRLNYLEDNKNTFGKTSLLNKTFHNDWTDSSKKIIDNSRKFFDKGGYKKNWGEINSSNIYKNFYNDKGDSLKLEFNSKPSYTRKWNAELLISAMISGFQGGSWKVNQIWKEILSLNRIDSFDKGSEYNQTTTDLYDYLDVADSIVKATVFSKYWVLSAHYGYEGSPTTATSAGANVKDNENSYIFLSDFYKTKGDDKEQKLKRSAVKPFEAGVRGSDKMEATSGETINSSEVFSEKLSNPNWYKEGWAERGIASIWSRKTWWAIIGNAWSNIQQWVGDAGKVGGIPSWNSREWLFGDTVPLEILKNMDKKHRSYFGSWDSGERVRPTNTFGIETINFDAENLSKSIKNDKLWLYNVSEHFEKSGYTKEEQESQAIYEILQNRASKERRGVVENWEIINQEKESNLINVSTTKNVWGYDKSKKTIDFFNQNTSNLNNQNKEEEIIKSNNLKDLENSSNSGVKYLLDSYVDNNQKTKIDVYGKYNGKLFFLNLDVSFEKNFYSGLYSLTNNGPVWYWLGGILNGDTERKDKISIPKNDNEKIYAFLKTMGEAGKGLDENTLVFDFVNEDNTSKSDFSLEINNNNIKDKKTGATLVGNINWDKWDEGGVDRIELCKTFTKGEALDNFLENVWEKIINEDYRKVEIKQFKNGGDPYILEIQLPGSKNEDNIQIQPEVVNSILFDNGGKNYDNLKKINMTQLLTKKLNEIVNEKEGKKYFKENEISIDNNSWTSNGWTIEGNGVGWWNNPTLEKEDKINFIIRNYYNKEDFIQTNKKDGGGSYGNHDNKINPQFKSNVINNMNSSKIVANSFNDENMDNEWIKLLTERNVKVNEIKKINKFTKKKNLYSFDQDIEAISIDENGTIIDSFDLKTYGTESEEWGEWYASQEELEIKISKGLSNFSSNEIIRSIDSNFIEEVNKRDYHYYSSNNGDNWAAEVFLKFLLEQTMIENIAWSGDIKELNSLKPDDKKAYIKSTSLQENIEKNTTSSNGIPFAEQVILAEDSRSWDVDNANINLKIGLAEINETKWYEEYNKNNLEKLVNGKSQEDYEWKNENIKNSQKTIANAIMNREHLIKENISNLTSIQILGVASLNDTLFEADWKNVEDYLSIEDQIITENYLLETLNKDISKFIKTKENGNNDSRIVKINEITKIYEDKRTGWLYPVLELLIYDYYENNEVTSSKTIEWWGLVPEEAMDNDFSTKPNWKGLSKNGSEVLVDKNKEILSLNKNMMEMLYENDDENEKYYKFDQYKNYIPWKEEDIEEDYKKGLVNDLIEVIEKSKKGSSSPENEKIITLDKLWMTPFVNKSSLGTFKTWGNFIEEFMDYKTLNTKLVTKEIGYENEIFKLPVSKNGEIIKNNVIFNFKGFVIQPNGEKDKNIQFSNWVDNNGLNHNNSGVGDYSLTKQIDWSNLTWKSYGGDSNIQPIETYTWNEIVNKTTNILSRNQLRIGTPNDFIVWWEENYEKNKNMLFNELIKSVNVEPEEMKNFKNNINFRLNVQNGETLIIDIYSLTNKEEYSGNVRLITGDTPSSGYFYRNSSEEINFGSTGRNVIKKDGDNSSLKINIDRGQSVFKETLRNIYNKKDVITEVSKLNLLFKDMENNVVFDENHMLFEEFSKLKGYNANQIRFLFVSDMMMMGGDNFLKQFRLENIDMLLNNSIKIQLKLTGDENLLFSFNRFSFKNNSTDKEYNVSGGENWNNVIIEGGTGGTILQPKEETTNYNLYWILGSVGGISLIVLGLYFAFSKKTKTIWKNRVSVVEDEREENWTREKENNDNEDF